MSSASCDRHFAQLGFGGRIVGQPGQHLQLGAQPPHLARRGGDRLDRRIILRQANELVRREARARPSPSRKFMLLRLDRRDPFGRNAHAFSASTNPSKATARCSPDTMSFSWAAPASASLSPMITAKRAAAGVGALHPSLHVAAKSHVGGDSGGTQLRQQTAGDGLAGVADRDQHGVRIFGLGRLDHHRQPLDPRRPADRRRVRAAERFDQAVVAAAGDDGALRAEAVGDEFEDRCGGNNRARGPAAGRAHRRSRRRRDRRAPRRRNPRPRAIRTIAGALSAAGRSRGILAVEDAQRVLGQPLLAVG